MEVLPIIECENYQVVRHIDVCDVVRRKKDTTGTVDSSVENAHGQTETLPPPPPSSPPHDMETGTNQKR